MLDIPAPDASHDFVYIINVLHHLGRSMNNARLGRAVPVLRPGGLLFVHEINTRILLFRFYMGYVFPSLNCIDEGVERGSAANKPAPSDTDARRWSTSKNSTFLPYSSPKAVVRLLSPVEPAPSSASAARVLLGALHGRAEEAGPLRRKSAR